MKVHKNCSLDTSLGRLLIVDDNARLLTALCETLADHGYETVGFIRGKEAVAALKEQRFDLMLTDIKMPKMDGITLIQEVLQIDPNMVPIVMTGQGTIETAVEAMKLGALDYVLKPFKVNLILPVLYRAMEVRRLRMKNIELHKTLAIYKLSMATAFVLEENLILNKMADTIIEEFKVDELSIMLPTKDNNELCVAIARGENCDHIIGHCMPIDFGIAGWVVQNKETITLNGEVDDPRFKPVHARPEIRSSVSVPMLTSGKLAGVLNVNAIHRHRFTPGDVKALTILVNIAASALESARLYEQVRQAETKYRSIFENAVEGIFQTTLDGHFLTANPAMARMFGYDTPEELISSTKDIGYQLFMEPKGRSEFMRLIDRQGFVTAQEFQVYRKDGSVIWISENVRAIKDNLGKVLWYEGTCEDITARKQAEEALRDIVEKLAQAIQGNSIPTFIIDNNHIITHWNNACESLTGYSAAEMVGTKKQWRAFYSAKRPVLADLIVDGATEEEIGGYYEEKTHKSILIEGAYESENFFPNLGEIGKWIFFTAAPLRDRGGNIIGAIETFQDNTERRGMEDQLRQAQKMEAIGTLAGGVAHDFNNLLTAILGYAELSLMGIGKDNPVREGIEEIKKAGNSAASLTRQLLAFSRKQVIQPKVIDLNKLLSGMEKMLGRLLSEDVELLTIPEPALWQVEIDPGQMEQVIMNLAINSGDVMPSGGKLTIETANVDLGENYFREHGIEEQPGSYVMLAVSDTGSGMDKETQEHIFEPFFTTKELGKGTGLGLSTVYGIVKQNNGFIWVYSEPGKGTTFKVYLPKVEGDAGPEEKERTLIEDLGGSETVLIVEDDDSLRKLTRTVLKQKGYKVLEAENGEDALKVSEGHDGSIDLMITDVVMPKMGGKEIAERLQPLYPQMKVIYMSGYTDNAIVHHGVLAPGLNFLEKPFSPKVLARKIREVLDK